MRISAAEGDREVEVKSGPDGPITHVALDDPLLARYPGRFEPVDPDPLLLVSRRPTLDATFSNGHAADNEGDE